MEVLIINEGALKIMISGARQLYPVGWRGVVEDHVGAVWVAEGLAEDITPDVGDHGFTARETQVLRGIANEVLAAHDAQVVDVDFSNMDLAELRELAAMVPIAGAERMTKARLIKSLNAAQDDLRTAMAAALDESADDDTSGGDA